MIGFEKLNLVYYTYNKESKVFIPRMECSSIFKVQEMAEVLEELNKNQVEFEVNLDHSISIVKGGHNS